MKLNCMHISRSIDRIIEYRKNPVTSLWGWAYINPVHKQTLINKGFKEDLKIYNKEYKSREEAWGDISSLYKNLSLKPPCKEYTTLNCYSPINYPFISATKHFNDGQKWQVFSPGNISDFSIEEIGLGKKLNIELRAKLFDTRIEALQTAIHWAEHQKFKKMQSIF